MGMFVAMTAVRVALVLAALVWCLGLRHRIRHPAVILVLVWAVTGLLMQGWNVLLQMLIVGPTGMRNVQALSLISGIVGIGLELVRWLAAFWALWAVSRTPDSGSVRQNPPQNPF